VVFILKTKWFGLCAQPKLSIFTAMESLDILKSNSVWYSDPSSPSVTLGPSGNNLFGCKH
jgi:hypothetical protein